VLRLIKSDYFGGNMLEKVKCPICRQEVYAYIPKGGDGSTLMTYSHNRFKARGTGRAHCKGSEQPVVREAKDADK
jgi:hypothetical protein